MWAGFHLPFGTQDFQHFWHTDTVGIPPTQCFLNEAPDLISNAALLSWLCNVVWIHLSLCFLFELVSAVWQHNTKTSPSTLNSFVCRQLFVFPLSFDTFPLSVRASLFSNLLCQSSPYTPVFFPNPVPSSHLFSPFIIPPQLLSVLLSLFILTSLCKGAGGEINYHCITQGYIWRHDATDVSGNILVPFLVVYFLMSCATLLLSLLLW